MGIGFCYTTYILINKEMEMKVIYTSPFNGQQYIVPIAGLATYEKRDAALLKMKEMGGAYAPLTPEFLKQHRILMSAKRKIDREGWFCNVKQ